MDQQEGAPKGRKRHKKRRVENQKQLITLLRRVKPGYNLRMPTKDKRGPFLYPDSGDVAGNSIQITESLFYKLRSEGKLRVCEVVDTPQFKYHEYELCKPKKKGKPKKRKRKAAVNRKVKLFPNGKPKKGTVR